tara:strand:+ start:85 stop:918 length:834 start_codon:yes stop_codon:yes gene_type:complete
MLSRFRRSNSDLSLEVGDGPYWPGDKVEVRASLLPRKSFYAREGRIELVCIETYYVQLSQGAPMQHTRELWRSATPFLSETQAIEGLPYGGKGILSLPPDAPPTVNGDAADITWRVQAAVDVAGARDIHQHHDVLVLSRVPERSPPETAEKTYDHCTLSLSLSSTTVEEGETLEGRFRVEVRQNLSVQGIRVELECQEKAKDKEVWIVKDPVLLRNREDLAAGQILEWPIRLHVPRHRLPSTEVHDTLVVWRVKGILDRHSRLDLDVEQKISVYTTP